MPQNRCVQVRSVFYKKSKAGSVHLQRFKRNADEQDSDRKKDVNCSFTWMQFGRLVLCKERATLTQLPQRSYCGLRAPTTPAVTAPRLIPAGTTEITLSSQLITDTGE